MKRCLDNNKLMEALKYASAMISVLRTSQLSPRNYYELYMVCFDQLRYLESFLAEEKQKGKKMSELYEVVQYAGNIIPRSYLLVTVGAVYIKTKEAPAKDVLRDLVEMCRGVQHPTRGLFLRNYLSEMTKDKLPDVDNEYMGEGEDGGGVVKDSIHFILQNFTEMNKLWVRMQRQGFGKNKSKREEERKELRLLVGKNLARLSQLEGVDVELYKHTVLPKIMDQIINCEDKIAQQYLMEIIIQVFPDQFHLQTLEELLGACSKLQQSVDPLPIFVSLIQRLANFAKSNSAQSNKGIPEELAIFDIFSKHIASVIQARPKMSPADKLSLHVVLLQMVLRIYPEDLSYVNKVFSTAFEMLSEIKGEDEEEIPRSKDFVTELNKLLHLPLDSYNNVLKILELQNYTEVLGFLDFGMRKRLASDIVKNVLKNETEVPTANAVAKLFANIRPLLRDNPDAVEAEEEEEDDEDFDYEQNMVAAIIHLLHNDNPEQQYLIYATARTEFGLGGPKRIKFTLPPLVFRSLLLAPQLKKLSANDEQWNKVGKKIFKFAHETVTALVRTNHKELAMRLFLQCSTSASICGFETIAYEFLTQVFEIYEAEVADSKAQFRAINEIIGTLQRMTVFGHDNYDTLITKTYMHAKKLLKKHDQCRAAYVCSHLFWAGEYKDGRKVLACLQSSLRVADTCMDSALNVRLFVEILNEYLYFFHHENEAVAVRYLTGLIALIKTHLANMEVGEDPKLANAVKQYFQNTIDHIKARQQEPGDNYSQISL
eukprot:TRINITY_DN5017_c0_g1_i2.p1 TRINITY_DN5017_c0_g1~~TRINITY_DN5017_c0_g1_i2.p1  ORF type:complete len:830 (-),score=162.17 TRINITY_DN5017_c0_g1_i2:86-2392(-)